MLLGLSIVATTISSACLGEMLDIHIDNRSDRAVEFDLVFRLEGDTPVEMLNDTYRLEDGEFQKWEDITHRTGTYTLSLTLDNGTVYTVEDIEFDPGSGFAGVNVTFRQEAVYSGGWRV